MNKKKFVIPTIILVLVCLLLGFDINAQLDTGGLTDIEELFQSNPFEATQQIANKPPLPTDAATQITGTGPISEVTPASTGFLSSGISLQSIIGSSRLIIMSGNIVGGLVVSSVENNIVPVFNPLTGDVIIYEMDLGYTVLIDYTDGPAYRSEMSQGVEAEILTSNRVRFTAYGKDSLLKIKSAEEPSYEFSNGLLEYENKNILEQINTTGSNDADIDSGYSYGFKCLTIAPEADYNYLDKNDGFRSFRIRNNNKKDYQVCLEKTAYDEYEQAGDFYSLVNIQDGYAKLKAAVSFEKEDHVVYESLDRFNTAEFRFDRIKKIASFNLANSKSSNGVLSKVYTGHHIITEERQGKIVSRHHQFSNEKYPSMIREYSSDLRFSKLPDIKIEDGILIQEGKNKFTALGENNVKLDVCESLLEKALGYNGYGDEFDEKC